jgi:hypothetical protein
VTDPGDVVAAVRRSTLKKNDIWCFFLILCNNICSKIYPDYERYLMSFFSDSFYKIGPKIDKRISLHKYIMLRVQRVKCVQPQVHSALEVD